MTQKTPTRRDNAQGERLSRDQEQRAAEPAHEEWDMDWNPDAGMLDTRLMPARPGFVQRWVRTLIQGVDDATNVMRRRNQGWRPRNPSTVPAGQYVPTVNMRGAEVIGMDGIVLMERPEKLHQKAADYVREKTARQRQSVEQHLMTEYGGPQTGLGAPQLKSESQVSTGSRPAPVADD